MAPLPLGPSEAALWGQGCYQKVQTNIVIDSVKLRPVQNDAWCSVAAAGAVKRQPCHRAALPPEPAHLECGNSAVCEQRATINKPECPSLKPAHLEREREATAWRAPSVTSTSRMSPPSRSSAQHGSQGNKVNRRLQEMRCTCCHPHTLGVASNHLNSTAQQQGARQHTLAQHSTAQQPERTRGQAGITVTVLLLLAAAAALLSLPILIAAAALRFALAALAASCRARGAAAPAAAAARPLRIAAASPAIIDWGGVVSASAAAYSSCKSREPGLTAAAGRQPTKLHISSADHHNQFKHELTRNPHRPRRQKAGRHPPAAPPGG